MNTQETYSFHVIDSKLWLEALNVNQDNLYGSGITRFAGRWATLTEQKIVAGMSFAEAVAAAEDEADDNGITGFMYNKAVQLLSRVWSYGDALRRGHNSKFIHDQQELATANFDGRIVNNALIGKTNFEQGE